MVVIWGLGASSGAAGLSAMKSEEAEAATGKMAERCVWRARACSGTLMGSGRRNKHHPENNPTQSSVCVGVGCYELICTAEVRLRRTLWQTNDYQQVLLVGPWAVPTAVHTACAFDRHLTGCTVTICSCWVRAAALPQGESLLLFQKTEFGSQIPQQVTRKGCNSNCRGPDALFWPLWRTAQTRHCLPADTHKHIKKSLPLFASVFWGRPP